MKTRITRHIFLSEQRELRKIVARRSPKRSAGVGGTILCLLALATTALAQPKMDYKAPELDHTKATAGTYILDTKHASVHWKIWHLGFSHYTGRFNEMTGTLQLNPTDLTKNKVSINIKSDSANTGFDVMDTKLDGADFFNAETFPAITFEASDVKITGKNQAGKTIGTVTGTLTMLGVSKPVTLNTTFNGSGTNPFGKGQTVGFSATTQINRSDFGLKGMIPMISDEVEIQIEVEFNLAS